MRKDTISFALEKKKVMLVVPVSFQPFPNSQLSPFLSHFLVL